MPRMVRLAFVGTAGLVVADELVRYIDVGDATALTGDLAAADLDGFAGETVIDLAGLDRDAGFWAAARDDRGRAWLSRRKPDGACVGERIALASPAGRWLVAPQTGAAVWAGDRAMLLAADGGHAPLELEPDLDVAIPIGNGQHIAARGQSVALRSKGVERWSANVAGPGTRITDGALLADGASVALVASGATRPQAIVVIALRGGAVLRRFNLTDVTSVAFAARRGYALLVDGDRRLVLVDLRFAQRIGEYEHDHAIAAVAIDPTATRLAICHTSDDGAAVLTCLACRDAFAAKPAESSDDDSAPAPRNGANGANGHVAAAPELDPIEPAEQPPVDATTRLELSDPPALWPRPRTPKTDRALALQLLEHERSVITALAFRAIASAWDVGRLVFTIETEHPYETEVKGLLGRQRGRASAQLAEAERDLVDARAALAEIQRVAAATLTPIDDVVAEFGLSPLARSILLVVVAPRIWGDIARLYGVVANDTQRAIVDEMLVRQILAGSADVHEIARELDNDHPLMRHGLVRLGTGVMRPFLALQVDSLVIKRLRGDELGAGSDPQLSIVDASCPLDELELPPGVPTALQAALGEVRDRPLRLVVRGRVGAGRETLLAALAASANRRLAMIDIVPILRDGRIKADVLREGLLRAMLGGWLPCVDNLDAMSSDDRTQRDLVRDILAAHPGPLLLRVGANVPPPLDPGFACIDLAPLPEAQRADVWRSALAEHALGPVDADELAAHWTVGPGVVHRVAANVARQNATDTPLVARIDIAVRNQLESRLGETASRVTRLASWAEIVLPSDVLDSLLELISRIRNRRTVFDLWGFERVMSTSRGLTALFQGGPGTGKTMVAGAIARELGLDLYRIDVSRVVSKWIGETEKNLAQVFDAAEDGHAILLFDEADSLFSKRTEVKTSNDRYANLEVNYLLQRLDSFGGIAVLTTNFGGGIDSAFKRRLSYRLSFPFPDDEMREQLWKAHLPPELPRAGTIDTGELARKYKMSGGYIRNSALRAAFLAAAEQSPLRQEHLERAVKLEYREIGKLVDTGALE
jgi:ATPase family associated with various cellular activities (AAA)